MPGVHDDRARRQKNDVNSFFCDYRDGRQSGTGADNVVNGCVRLFLFFIFWEVSLMENNSIEYIAIIDCYGGSLPEEGLRPLKKCLKKRSKDYGI